jgi:hypothetical protein
LLDRVPAGASTRRLPWQVYRRVPRRGFVRVAATHGDRVASHALGCWLHGVAYRVAVRAAVNARRRREREREAAAMKEASADSAADGWEVRSVLRFQKEHPELEGRSITEYAHRISGIDRLIFIEIADFSTRNGTAVQLLKGGMTANVKVLEIGDKSSKIVFEELHVQVNYPPKAPEGVIDMSEAAVYGGTVDTMALQVAQLFYPHIIEDK